MNNHFFCIYTSREVVLPVRMSTIPSRMSRRNSGSDKISSVSIMPSYLSFLTVTVVAIYTSTITHYLNFSGRNHEKSDYR